MASQGIDALLAFASPSKNRKKLFRSHKYTFKQLLKTICFLFNSATAAVSKNFFTLSKRSEKIIKRVSF